MTAPKPARRKPGPGTAALVALAGAAAVCAPLEAAAEPHGGGHGHGGHMGGPRGGFEGGPRGGYERGPRGGGYERGPRGYEGRGGGWERGERGEREDEDRWDERRYNGFWLNNRWHYGEPPGAAYRDPGFRPGFAPWRRGAYLPPSYQGYVVDEYWRFHLRRPPYGYHWVQVGDDYLLVSVSTGVIFDIVSGQ